MRAPDGMHGELISSLFVPVFPEMKTALRTYHPVPALQRTNGNLQDAPRIKNILKTCFLQEEAQGTVSTPADVLARSVRIGLSSRVPPLIAVDVQFHITADRDRPAHQHCQSHLHLRQPRDGRPAVKPTRVKARI